MIGICLETEPWLIFPANPTLRRLSRLLPRDEKFAVHQSPSGLAKSAACDVS